MGQKLFGFLVLASLIVCSSCGFFGRSSHHNTVTIAGSTSVMPFTEKLAEHFMLERPGVSVDVQGGGSSAGIQATMNRTVGIGMSSRELKGDEKTLNAIVICHDAIAVVVNPKNPIVNLTIEQVKGIYSGRVRNWKQLGWIDRNISAVTREEGSGTRGAFEDLVMKKAYIDDGVMVQDSNGAVREVVGNDPYAVGYISLGIVDSRVKTVSVDGVIPGIKTVRNKSYGLVRPFLYLTLGAPTPRAQVFIDFVLSPQGQTILKKEGLVPVHG
jgi:phosphate transport system substrate-binding protein